jgi:hypothetical protein
MNNLFSDPDFWLPVITVILTLVVAPVWMAFH